jgi:hypothetical protein
MSKAEFTRVRLAQTPAEKTVLVTRFNIKLVFCYYIKDLALQFSGQMSVVILPV